MSRTRRAFAGTLLVPLLVLGWIWFSAPDRGWPGAAGTPPPVTPEQIERGRYLARAGNCIACHTEQGGAEYAGGRGIPTPFGTVYSSNLTPDEPTGLGAWSADEFWRALHYGRSRDGRRLYPAFPYTHYTRVTRTDANAMYVYLRSLPPVRKPTPPAQLRFPYNTQLALRVWRALYFRPGELAPAPARTAQWNRGAYLVEGLGHCDACHSPRTGLGGIEASARYAGGPIPMLGWDALPLTSATPLDEAQAAELRELLKAGTSRSAVLTGPMAEVVFHSLQYLSDDDIAAIVEYLRTLPHAAPATPRSLPVSEAQRKAQMVRGAAVYREHCADCHGDEGQGQPYRYPALAGNRLVTAPSPSNAIETVLFGGYGASTAALPMPYGMPPYAQALSREDIAAVLTYIRGSWGNTAAPVSPTAVERH